MRNPWRVFTAYLATLTNRLGAGRVSYQQGVNRMCDVGLDDDVLYRLQSTGEWMRGKVGAIDPDDGKLRIALMDGTEAVEVPHGFGVHEWCTLEELVEHRKVANA